MLTRLEYRLLKLIAPGEPAHMDGSAYAGHSKIEALLGPDFFSSIAGRTVLDFGCGKGRESIEMALRGASRVIGLDIIDRDLDFARRAAAEAGVADRCEFARDTAEKADVVLSIDAFEHYREPERILDAMRRLLQPGGRIFISFGPPWYHPLGGHLLSMFPWAHVIFSEPALMRWRADLRSDGARKFSECEGGLNQMTVARFERIVAASGLKVQSLQCRPIRKLRPLHSRLTREFTTALVRCELAG